jgi:hypothetical protein
MKYWMLNKDTINKQPFRYAAESHQAVSFLRSLAFTLGFTLFLDLVASCSLLFFPYSTTAQSNVISGCR